MGHFGISIVKSRDHLNNSRQSRNIRRLSEKPGATRSTYERSPALKD